MNIKNFICRLKSLFFNYLNRDNVELIKLRIDDHEKIKKLSRLDHSLFSSGKISFYIIKFCVGRKKLSFTEKQLKDFSGNFPYVNDDVLESMTKKGFLIKDDDMYKVTDFFIEECISFVDTKKQESVGVAPARDDDTVNEHKKNKNRPDLKLV